MITKLIFYLMIIKTFLLKKFGFRKADRKLLNLLRRNDADDPKIFALLQSDINALRKITYEL